MEEDEFNPGEMFADFTYDFVNDLWPNGKYTF